MTASTSQHRPLVRIAAGRAPIRRPRVGLWLACFATGGVERYHLDCARATEHAIDWVGCVLDPHAVTHADTLAELRREMPVVESAAELLANDPDVIITWNITDLSALDGFAGDVVIIQHGDTGWSRGWADAAIASTTHAVHLVNVSESSAGVMQGFNAVSVCRQGFGIDLNRISPTMSREQVRGRLAIGNRRLLGFVGRISDEKNPLMAARVAGRLPNCFALYHCPCPSEAFQKEAAEVSKGNVYFAPRTWSVGDTLNSIDALLVSSHYEAGPMVAVEAWLSGVPLASTRVGILREHPDWFSPVENPNSEQSFADAVERAMQPNPSRLESIRLSAMELYSSRVSGNRWVSYLRRLVGARQP